jgi:hypothetical protein
MVENRRKHQRFPDDSTVELGGSLDQRGKLVDLSVTGVRVVFDAKQKLKGEKEYALKIRPGKAPDLRPFSLIVKLVWSDTRDHCTEAGFAVVSSPTGDEFQHYLDFISYKPGNQNHAD